MLNLYLDLRNRETRLLVVDGVAVVHAEHFTEQPDNAAELGQFLERLKGKAGAGISRAHLILPMEEVKAGLHKTQAENIRDAEVIIRRALTAETGDPEPNFRLTRLAAKQGQEVYLSEYIPAAVIEKYVRMFKAVKVRLQTVTTSFQAQLAHVKLVREESEDVQLFIDVGPRAVEAVFFTPDEIIHHDFLETLPAVDEISGEKLDSDTEKGSKRKLYEVMNVVHSIYSHFMTAHTMITVDRVWLCGPESSMEGLAETLSEAVGLDVVKVEPGLKGLEDKGADYGTLDGFVQQVAVKAAVNFIPARLLRRFQINPRKVYLVLGAFYALALMLGVVLIEKQISNRKKLLDNEKNSLALLQNSAVRSRDQAKNFRKVRDMIEKRIPFYDIFRELSGVLPSEVRLEGLDFRQEKDRGILVISAVSAYPEDIGSSRVLSRYIAALESSELFGRISEPVISFSTVKQEKLMRIDITCELLEREVF